jgi:hypothetical protein
VSLTNGQATCTTSASAFAVSGSPYSVTASYLGNISYGPSTGTISQAVGTTATSLTSSINPSTLNQAVTYTATVSAIATGSPNPSGSVEFIDNNTPVAGCGGAGGKALNGGSPDVATCTVTYTVGAIHSVTATYLGNASFAGSNSTTLLQSVGPQLSNIAEAPATGSQRETFTGNTNEGTGTVAVYICSGSVASCSPTSAGFVVQYSTTTFTGSSPTFGWSVTTNTADLMTGSIYTAQASQIDSSAQASVNAPTVQFTAN